MENQNPRSNTRKTQNTTQQFSKLPPHAIDLEEAVLGAIIIEKDALMRVIDTLKPESFYKESHVRIYSAIVDLFNTSSPVDMLTVTAKLRSTGELEIVGGLEYIMGLMNKVNSGENIEYHAKIISQAYIKRSLISLSATIQREAYEDTTDAFVLTDKAEQELFNITKSTVKKNFVQVGEGVKKSFIEMDEKQKNDSPTIGTPSGFESLDRLTAGWQKAELIIGAARPGMGKTAFVVSTLRNAAVDFNKAVALFSLEMSTMQIVNRMISSECEIDSDKIRRAKLTPYEWEDIHRKIGPLSVAPIFIDDTPSLTILELRAKCRRLKAQHDIQLIVIDYLQLMSSGNDSKFSSSEQEIAMISRSLKILAKELDVPVIALSQLSRDVERRPDKRPQLSDLRQSGAIEQDADVVMFFYRPEYYGILQDESGNSTLGLAEVIVAKNRSGSLGTARLRFVGKYTKFTNFNQDYDVFKKSTISLDTPILSFGDKKPVVNNITFTDSEPF